MVENSHYDAQPELRDVVEISRRIKSGQRPSFLFTKTLAKLLAQKDLELMASPQDVRINLVSRYDNLNPKDVPKFAKLGGAAISDLIGVSKTSTCDEYSTLSLKPAILSDKGDGWQAVELPVDESDHSFVDEREALTAQIDKTIGEGESIWYPETPALQVIEFKADASTSQAILDYVTAVAPKQSEVFAASLRFRPQVV
jgi:hypothetical protein